MTLTDYGGEFRPNLKLSDFTPETLANLLILYSKLYMGLDGFWYLAVKEKCNNKIALDCDLLTWQRASRYEMTRITKRFNIQGNDVIALMKAMQLSPWFWTIKGQMEVENQNRAVLTVTYCPTLDALEKEGEGRENQICNTVEPQVFQHYASSVNPDIRAKCLKSAPRKSRDDICCQWEFKLG